MAPKCPSDGKWSLKLDDLLKLADHNGNISDESFNKIANHLSIGLDNQLTLKNHAGLEKLIDDAINHNILINSLISKAKEVKNHWGHRLHKQSEAGKDTAYKKKLKKLEASQLTLSFGGWNFKN